MALILLAFRRYPCSGHEQEINAMQHHNRVFHQLQRHIPWATFDRLVEDYRAVHRVRRLPSQSQLQALLFGQLSGAVSLREIEAAMSSHRSRLYHVGAKLPARSTLSDANAKRPWRLFADLFTHMAQAASRRTRPQMNDAVGIIDATHKQGICKVHLVSYWRYAFWSRSR